MNRAKNLLKLSEKKLNEESKMKKGITLASGKKRKLLQR